MLTMAWRIDLRGVREKDQRHAQAIPNIERANELRRIASLKASIAVVGALLKREWRYEVRINSLMAPPQ